MLPCSDDAALRGIDPEPAARCGRRLVVDADRGLDHIAHAVAEFQVGAGSRHSNEMAAAGSDSNVRRHIAASCAEAAPSLRVGVACDHLWISVPVP